MKIKVWTQQPDHFISETRKVLRQHGHSRAEADALQNGQSDGELVTFSALSGVQFCALEDTAVRLGLPYDGSQEEPQCPEGYVWNGRQCLKGDNLLRPSIYEREGF